MNWEMQLKVQSYLDGELSRAETAEVEGILRAEPAAARLLTELRWLKQAIVHQELQVLVPESREFYWSKIERNICSIGNESADSLALSSVSFWNWRRWLAPALGLSLAALVVFAILQHYDLSFNGRVPRYLALVESPSEEMGALSFRSQSENMFVVWLYDRPTAKDDQMSFINDLIIQ